MSLELISTVASVATALVIAGTAIAALIQLRHMRAGNQISAFLTLRSMLDQPGHLEAKTLILLKLDSLLEDPGFRAFCQGTEVNVPESKLEQYSAMTTAARLIGNTYDAMGTLVRNGIIDRQMFLDQYCSVIDRDWTNLEVLTDYFRAQRNDPGIWEDFEYLTVLARQFQNNRPTSFPKDMPHIELHNPWRVKSCRPN